MSVKTTFKRTISGFVHGLNRFSGKDRAVWRVLNYHSVTDGPAKGDHYQMTTPKALFAEHMRYLSDNDYEVLPCDDLVNILSEGKTIPEKAVSLTFDDGFKDNLVNAAPLLKKHEFRFTVFLATDFIGRSGEYLSWDDIERLRDTGLASFGSHSLSHRKLPSLDNGELEKELGISKDILEGRLGKTIDLFAYPFGSYGSFDRRVMDFVVSNGYKAAFTTIAGPNTADSDLFSIKRMRISHLDKVDEFSKELEGAYDWYRLWQMITRTP